MLAERLCPDQAQPTSDVLERHRATTEPVSIELICFTAAVGPGGIYSKDAIVPLFGA